MSRFSIPLDSEAAKNPSAAALVEMQLRQLAGNDVLVSIHDGQVIIESAATQQETADLQMTVARFLSRISKSLQAYTDPPVEEHSGSVTFSEDPFPALVGSGQITRIDDGVYSYCGEFRNALEAVDRLFLDFAVSLGAMDMWIPTTLSTEFLIRCGYVNSFPHHVILAAPIQSDPASLATVSKLAPDSSSMQETVRRVLGMPRQILIPALCYACFARLRERTEQVGEKVFTVGGVCHRLEETYDRMLRLQSFRMREIVFLGSSTAAIEAMRQKIIAFCAGLLRAVDLRFRVIVAADPFFAGAAESKTIFQIMNKAKYELQMYIPFANSWSSVMSFNHHHNAIVRALQLSPRTLHSGCFGVGYERLAFAIACQRGPASLSLHLRAPLESREAGTKR